jgi:adenylate cyclase
VFYKKKPSKLTPLLCNVCDEFASEHQGGAEVELTLLFVDVRGSTALAEKMSPTDFSKLVNRFYNAATKVMIRTDALIDKIIGDQAAGMYVPGFAGSDHAQQAIHAAQEILHAVGYGTPEGPWLPLGAGVLTGTAYVGAVGSAEGTTDITVLGDAANTAARLSGEAATGEILISETAYQAAGLDMGGLEIRDLELKGKTDKTRVHVLIDYEN